MGPAGDEVLVVGLLVKIVGEGLGAVDAAEFEAVGLGGGVWFCQCLFYPVGREGGLRLCSQRVDSRKGAHRAMATAPARSTSWARRTVRRLRNQAWSVITPLVSPGAGTGLWRSEGVVGSSAGWPVCG